MLGAGFIDPEISPTDRHECRDRPTGEISGLAPFCEDGLPVTICILHTYFDAVNPEESSANHLPAPIYLRVPRRVDPSPCSWLPAPSSQRTDSAPIVCLQSQLMSIKNILVTGANGFVGRNLCAHLARREDLTLFRVDVDSAPDELDRAIESAEIIFHLAGVNRPKDPGEFQSGNAGFTEDLCAKIAEAGRKPLLVLSSSIQAALENPYGVSKRGAEDAVKDWAERGGGRAVIFRLKNVFGKWCRPNYNSVTATFCHNIAHDLPITINDPDKELDLVYIDDVVEAFGRVIEHGAGSGERGEDRRQRTEDRGRRTEDGGQRMENAERKPLDSANPSPLPPGSCPLPLSASPLPLVPCPLPPGPWAYREVDRSYRLTLGELAARIRSFREMRRTLVLPDLGDPLNRCLYATYLSYLDGPDFAYRLDQKTDPRGSLAEFVKSATAGQIFVSRTKPGITRGNHYHHTKTEKFLVLEGEAIIRFRRVDSREQGAGSREQGAEICGRYRAEHPGSSTSQAASTLPELPAPGSGLRAPRSELPAAVIEHRVSGRDFVVVDIPPGYTHSIENVGSGELVTLFWASEPFNPQRPDTYGMEVGR